MLQSVVRALAARNRMQLETPMEFAKWRCLPAVVLAGIWTLGPWGAYALLGMSDEGLRAGSSLLTGDPQLPEQVISFVRSANQAANAGDSHVI